MPESDQNQISELEQRLDRLVKTQVDFQLEVNRIRNELARLRGEPPRETAKLPPEPIEPVERPKPVETPRPQPRPSVRYQPVVNPPTFGTEHTKARRENAAKDRLSQYVSNYTETARADLERFIGENLISKIGILVLIIGVGIGAKYAIDNNLISPVLRIVLGYVVGAALLGLAVKLKAKYHNFSAVLLSGGMAVMYFITFFAYSAYQLIGQSTAFPLMAMFTIFTVAAAIFYERQVIAHIGLVGAYAVPFLLSDDSGRFAFLFTYMAILNAGILAISIWKHWKPLFYTASGFTWLIFASWFGARYSAADHFYLALVFTSVFFAIFYATKIIHGVVHTETSGTETIACIIGTGFVFYCFCFVLANSRAGIAEYTTIFTFLAVVALVILLTSYRFYGRIFVYLAYPFTWLIFASWFLNYYAVEQHFLLATVFASVFFAVFYGATLVYRLVTDELGLAENAALIMTNSFLFYGASYVIIDSREALRGYEGLFTVGHGALHSLIAQVVSRIKPHAEDIIHFLTILILTFATIAVPIQFDGNGVTLIWSVEAALLFAYGRMKGTTTFEYFAYPVMALAVGSLIVDWVIVYADRTMSPSEFNRPPFTNGDFVTGLVFVAAFAALYVINREGRYTAAIPKELATLFGIAVGAIGLGALYNIFRVEIDNFHWLRYVLDIRNRDPLRLSALWQTNYTMFFLTAMAAVNIRRVRSELLAYVGVGASMLALLVFSVVGMSLMYELRINYASGGASWLNIAIRYISYAFAAGLLASLFVYSRSELLTKRTGASAATIGFDAVLFATGFIVGSCELVNLMQQFGIADATKLGLSILWGVYALMLIVVGIAKDKKYLRIAAIVILAGTLLKLFLYDVADLPTIPKTILFVSLGTLLLFISFLYNKYKDVIFGKTVE